MFAGVSFLDSDLRIYSRYVSLTGGVKDYPDNSDPMVPVITERVQGKSWIQVGKWWKAWNGLSHNESQDQTRCVIVPRRMEESVLKRVRTIVRLYLYQQN